MDLDTRIAVCSRSFSQNLQLRSELLAKFKNVKFNDTGRTLAGQELVEFLKGSRRAIVGLEKINSEILGDSPELKVISKYGVGLDNLDRLTMKKLSVSLGWTPGVNASSVAELALFMSLYLVRNISSAITSVQTGEWKQTKGSLLSSATFGILGCGHVGKALVKILRPFNCNILVHDIKNYSEFYKEYGVQEVDFETLIKNSSVLSIHIPKDNSQLPVITKDVLEKMQRGSIIINTARGGLIEEEALWEKLNTGHIAGAGIDVLEQEPPQDFRLIHHPHVIATPHIGGSTFESILAMGRAAIVGLTNFKSADFYE
ncbi:MAG: phosphoglycerate dehydrogenase [Bacteriovoracaceae bacterium]|nr:phosphoglycerate dehydrogenase [Bacteriovoracaceae bacterium]